MKKFIAVILSSTMIFTSGFSVFANDLNITDALKIKNNKINLVREKSDISVSNHIPEIFVNGKKLDINEGEVLYENNKFIPVRQLADTLNLKLDYVEEAKIVVLDDGNIQLPIDNNKASVNGKIVSIDEANQKVCPIIVGGKAYLPVNFVTNVLGYNVEYKGDKAPQETENSLQEDKKLDKQQALDAYKAISEASENIKNATIDLKSNVKINMTDGTDSLNMVVDTTGMVAMNIKDKIDIYSEQKSTTELMGEKAEVVQKMFYKDGKMYINQNIDGQEIKYKMALNIDEAMEISTATNVNNFLTEDMILEASVKELQDGNKQYKFILDMEKMKESSKKIFKELDLTEEDLAILDSYTIENSNIVIEVDKDNQPTSYNMNFLLKLSAEDINIKADTLIDMKYKNIGTTRVNIPNEDLSTYEDIDKVLEESQQ